MCVHVCVCVCICVVRGMSSPDPRREQCDIVGIQQTKKKQKTISAKPGGAEGNCWGEKVGPF